jgi:hypothetical protein
MRQGKSSDRQKQKTCGNQTVVKNKAAAIDEEKVG